MYSSIRSILRIVEKREERGRRQQHLSSRATLVLAGPHSPGWQGSRVPAKEYKNKERFNQHVVLLSPYCCIVLRVT